MVSHDAKWHPQSPRQWQSSISQLAGAISPDEPAPVMTEDHVCRHVWSVISQACGLEDGQCYQGAHDGSLRLWGRPDQTRWTRECLYWSANLSFHAFWLGEYLLHGQCVMNLVPV